VPFRVRRLALLGCGLMGGSLSLALKRAGVVEQVVAMARSPQTLHTALARGVINEGYHSIAQAVTGADVVVLALPVAATEAALREALPHVADGAILTDVGSTKRDVVSAARVALGASIGRFVPAHPIAGKEQSGVEHACADLFDGRRTILTPLAENAAGDVQRIQALWEAAGSSVSRMTPAGHDRAFAAVSHLPHLAAFAYINGLVNQADGASLMTKGGPGFRDFTRIAAGDPAIWRDILLANADEVIDQLDHLNAALNQFRQTLQAGDADALHRLISQASAHRRPWTLQHEVWDESTS
jgi:prephenate dehydrogenase